MSTDNKMTQQEAVRLAYMEQIMMLINAGLIDEAKKIEAMRRKEFPTLPSVVMILKLREFITQNPDMLKLKQKVEVLESLKYSVLIRGETGTGKEILAKALHGSRLGKFVDLNCAAFPPDLLESEIFGHMKGSFTGAYQDKTGLIETAKGGTLFLDEIGEMPLQLQAKLLRVIQEERFRKVGGTENITMDTRLVCATNRVLSDEIDNGKFREDLYYRIATIELITTPLRERRDDIPLIVASLPFGGELLDNKEKFEVVKNDDLNGNVRELQRIVINYHLFREV
jgi:transcriptional regulator with PAS, ATPase and Fis domain